MSATPGDHTPEPSSPANTNSQDGSVNADKVFLDYLRSRGFRKTEQAMREEMESGSPSENARTTRSRNKAQVNPAELVKKISPHVASSSSDTGNAMSDAEQSLNLLESAVASMPGTPGLAKLLASLGATGAEEALSLDPTDKAEGFKDLEMWVDGSLDMYQVCLEPYRFSRRSFDYLLALA